MAKNNKVVTEEGQERVADIIPADVGDAGIEKGEDAKFQPYLRFYDRVSQIVRANAERFSVSGYQVGSDKSVVVDSRAFIGGKIYEVGIDMSFYMNTRNLDELVYIAEHDTSLDRVLEIEQCMIHFIHVGDTDPPASTRNGVYIGRAHTPGRGTLDILADIKNVTLGKVDDLLTTMEAGIRFEPRYSFDPTYAQFESRQPADGVASNLLLT